MNQTEHKVQNTMPDILKKTPVKLNNKLKI